MNKLTTAILLVSTLSGCSLTELLEPWTSTGGDTVTPAKAIIVETGVVQEPVVYLRPHYRGTLFDNIPEDVPTAPKSIVDVIAHANANVSPAMLKFNFEVPEVMAKSVLNNTYNIASLGSTNPLTFADKIDLKKLSNPADDKTLASSSEKPLNPIFIVNNSTKQNPYSTRPPAKAPLSPKTRSSYALIDTEIKSPETTITSEITKTAHEPQLIKSQNTAEVKNLVALRATSDAIVINNRSALDMLRELKS